MQSFLNCYLRETSYGQWEQNEEGMFIYIALPKQGITFKVHVKYSSPTGRHLFHFPIYYASENTDWLVADYVTLTTLLIKELTLSQSSKMDDSSEELISRIIQSCQYIQSFVQARQGDEDQLYQSNFNFLDAEQALLFGHLIHPTPKSRQGILEEENALFSPELKGQFQLHYFRAHHSIVLEDSNVEQSATNLVKRELSLDPTVPLGFIEKYGKEDDYSLLPIHPLQARWLLKQPYVQALIHKGKLEYLGAIGKPFFATSSLRTVYHPESSFMYKFSVQVKVTNSLRINLFKELVRGVEVDRLMESSVGDVQRKFPQFKVLGDPAYLTIKVEGLEESGFEVVIRNNPFREEKSSQATLIAALVQDPLPGHSSRLAAIIKELAAKEGKSIADISVEWFRSYLDISLRPMLWLYLNKGIALEAHQQNSIVQLKDGYPHKFYYRDNQGYYFCDSMKDYLVSQLNTIGEVSQTLCSDTVADERLRYYLIFNHMFGLINGFGSAGLISESLLLKELKRVLEEFVPFNRDPSVFLSSLLTYETLPCKANLLTRLFDMDELVGSLETQSVYVDVENPLVKEVHQDHDTSHGTSKAFIRA
ncbi:IucA/IucC family protein [Metabacillus fastidiosus]|uniref:IucA/IucC family protein n=1 Tax=Metabacillus fastidiosus TaxID=1458 RepID=UPI003D26D39A